MHGFGSGIKNDFRRRFVAVIFRTYSPARLFPLLNRLQFHFKDKIAESPLLAVIVFRIKNDGQVGPQPGLTYGCVDKVEFGILLFLKEHYGSRLRLRRTVCS